MKNKQWYENAGRDEKGRVKMSRTNKGLTDYRNVSIMEGRTRNLSIKMLAEDYDQLQQIALKKMMKGGVLARYILMYYIKNNFVPKDITDFEIIEAEDKQSKNSKKQKWKVNKITGLNE